ncbi:organic cation transporter protein-like [Homarus americanus]|uniref:organic cation transporter protein-like n=1 Tax=Homarus americanus TaxID=6706 RepID=UPI001C46FF84|nr:organic cation transporter protein-like [Homarus americanus]XP_042219670.1 organic cation transporter protein-like [Homarus americanus]XP_042219671.1 organic cation transporter protein-like [Homarus americanus]XP_042219672.1 organic cation transporter protein-like [Homarus americanus]
MRTEPGTIETGVMEGSRRESEGGETPITLLQPTSTDPEEDPEKFKLSLLDCEGGFDQVLELAGSWGLWQKKVFVISHLAQVFCAMHAVSAVFLSFTPDHWCNVPGLNDTVQEMVDPPLHPHHLKNFSIPWTSKNGYAKCEYYNHNYTTLLPQLVTEEGPGLHHLPINASTTTCDSWVFDESLFQSTLVSEFSLVCGRRWMMATVQASYMSGLLLGSLVMGQLSDRFGRRKMSVMCGMAVVVIGIVASFVNTYMQFLALRFIIAFLCSGLMVINFVLVMEVVKPKARTLTGMMYALFFGLGITILPGFAYFIRDWRYLELAIGLFSSSLIAYYWILPESPRWLASQGRVQDALVILKDIARTNKKKLPSDQQILRLISRVHDKEVESSTETQPTKWYSGIVNTVCAQMTLVRTPVIRRRCLISFFLWFVAASVYYGLIFSGTNIKADPFLMIFISGLVEFPSAIVFISVLDKFGRRPTMCGLFVACGACLLAILAVPEDQIYVNFFLVNLGKFFTTAVFQQQFLYTGELMPTNIRNIAVGTSSMIARIGCVITPYIITLLGDVHYALPSTLFGILSMAAGLLTLLLPETNNTLLPETVAEVEAMPK